MNKENRSGRRPRLMLVVKIQAFPQKAGTAKIQNLRHSTISQTHKFYSKNDLGIANNLSFWKSTNIRCTNIVITPKLGQISELETFQKPKMFV
jgi:hypothetical protein